MAKMTKTQARNLCKDIHSKAKRLFMQGPGSGDVKMNVKDMDTIDRLTTKWLRVLK